MGGSLGPLGPVWAFTGRKLHRCLDLQGWQQDISGNSHPEWSVAGAQGPGLGSGDSSTVAKVFLKTCIRSSEVNVLVILLAGGRWAYML